MIDFFYPPQPTRIWPDADLFKSIDQNPNWIGEIKYNGWRLLLFVDHGIHIFNRHATEIAIDSKIFAPHFADVPDGTVFDGELVDRRTKDLKNVMVFWDAPFYAGRDLRAQPLKIRRQHLDHFGTAPEKITQKSAAQVYKAQQFRSGNLIALYHQIEARANDLEEGLVLKNTLSKYRSHPKRGIDIIDWIKVKKIGDHAKV